MQLVKPPRLETTADRAASEADVDELPAGDDAVLARGERGDLGVERTRPTFCIDVMSNVGRAGHASMLARAACRRTTGLPRITPAFAPPLAPGNIRHDPPHARPAEPARPCCRFAGGGNRASRRRRRAWGVGPERRPPSHLHRTRAPHTQRQTTPPRIFGLSTRAHRDHDGAGVGLAVCRRLAEAHGGRIWVEPADGGGSAFRFTLPR
jgi:Histidine kinase-, DNA gyrase B-, and HSP90-like ATPase